jgi:orotate phosphoribosyltransferase
VNVEQVLNEFKKSGALLEGHFILSSGLHSDKFLQKALVVPGRQAHRQTVQGAGRQR